MALCVQSVFYRAGIFRTKMLILVKKQIACLYCLDTFQKLIMRSTLKIIGIVFLSMAGKAAVAQAQPIDSLIGIQRAADPQEKMHVHFDKNFYNPGETIWFKAYLFTGLDRSQISKNFYAELRDENGVLLDKKTAPVIMSGAASSFDLDSNYKKSTVYFRAYTTSMLNGDTNFLYVKPLRVVVAPKKVLVKPAPPVPEIKFLAEGGDLVAGLSSVVAFKATAGQNNAPVAVTGIVKSADGAKVADIITLHDGMGQFTITPEAGKTYTAVWKDETKKEYTTALPTVRDNGIVLHINAETEGKKFTILRRPDAPDEAKALTVVAIMNQQLVYQASINMAVKTSVSAVLPTVELTSGILQITVLDKNYKPLAERICFVNNNNFEFDADAWISDFNPVKRTLNRAEVKITDSVTANFSLSITDADLDVPTAFDDNIVSRMLLTGDLRGKVNQPYYYFFSTSDSAAIHLDLVMLTNGWRRYNWENVMAGKTIPPKYLESNYLSITGQIAGNGSYADGLQLNGLMQTADSNKTLLVLPIDKKGKVLSDGMLFYDSAKMYLKFNDKNRDFDAAMFNVNNGLLQGNYTAGLSQAIKQVGMNLDSTLLIRNLNKNAAELKIAAKRFKDAHELQNVVVKGRVKSNVQKLDERYASGLFSGGDAIQFDVMNDPFGASSFSIFQYLQGKVAGLQINTGGGTPSLSWRGGSPALYLNEMQSDAQMLGSTPMTDVAYIKVLRPGSAGAISNSGGGVISVYTKRGGDATSTVDSKLSIVRITGYSPIKEFYAPDYSSPSPEDYYENLNTTLYWEPFIVLNGTKKRQKIQFYNNDITKRFRLVLEGIDDNGKLIHIEKIAEK